MDSPDEYSGRHPNYGLESETYDCNDGDDELGDQHQYRYPTTKTWTIPPDEKVTWESRNNQNTGNNAPSIGSGSTGGLKDKREQDSINFLKNIHTL